MEGDIMLKIEPLHYKWWLDPKMIEKYGLTPKG
jgi:hypothetical protein